MIIKFGTLDEVKLLPKNLSSDVIDEISRCINILNDAYGAERNYYTVGGYVIYAETNDDLKELGDIFSNKTNEWELLTESHILRLYLLGDDFSVVLCTPKNI